MLLTLVLLTCIGTGAVAPAKQTIGVTATSISPDGPEKTALFKTTVYVYPKDAPALKVLLWTDKQNYTSGERIFAHVNAQFMNKTDVGEIKVWVDGEVLPVIDTTVLPNHPVTGISKFGYDWDVKAGHGNSTPGEPV